MAKYKQYLYTPILLAALAWASPGHAQTDTTDTTSEIWMTEAELESLLTRIAIRKKQRLEEQKQTELVPRAAAVAWPGQPAWNSQADNHAALQGQIDALNRQISTLSAALLAERRANGNTHEVQIANVQRAIDALNSALVRQQYQSAMAQPPIIIESGQATTHQPVQPIIVQQPSSQAPARAAESALVASTVPAAQASAADSALAQRLHASTQLNFQLQGQVDELYKQLYSSRRDSVADTGADEALQATIDALAREVDQLREQALAATPEPETETPESEVRHPAIDLYRHSIYFANNSTSISDSDIDALRQLHEQVSKSSSPTKVVLRGFSSTTGNAQYNVRLSSQRADAVKDVLIQLGLPATDIVTLYHGPDDSKRADLARRVEVTLSAD